MYGCVHGFDEVIVVERKGCLMVGILRDGIVGGMLVVSSIVVEGIHAIFKIFIKWL